VFKVQSNIAITLHDRNVLYRAL